MKNWPSNPVWFLTLIVLIPIWAGLHFYQLHHRFFDCNYGTWETPWDTWFGTFHDGTSEGNERIKERRRKIWSPR